MSIKKEKKKRSQNPMLKGYGNLEVFIHRNVLEDKKDFLREKTHFHEHIHTYI